MLVKEMADTPVDLSLLEKGWEIKKGRWASTGEAIEKRAREARQWLRARPEKEIALVGHGGLLHYLTEDWSGSEKYAGQIAPTLTQICSDRGAIILSPKITLKFTLDIQVPAGRTPSSAHTNSLWAKKVTTRPSQRPRNHIYEGEVRRPH